MEIVNSPQYGKLLSILATYPMSLPENGKEALESGSPNPWLANSSHPLAIMLAVGGKVSSVVMHRDRNGRGVCLLEFANGITGNLHFASGPQPLEHYFFYGEDWNLTIDNGLRVSLNRGIPFQYDRTFNYIPAGADTGSIVWEPQNCWATLENKALFTQGMYAEMKYFCDCILNGEKAERGSLEFAVELMKVHEAVLLSNGARIAIN
jgi:predicted dehydrogenase